MSTIHSPRPTKSMCEARSAKRIPEPSPAQYAIARQRRLTNRPRN